MLFVVFLTTVAAAFLPPRLLDAAWQLRLISVLLPAAPMALIGLALLQLLVLLEPEDPVLLRRQQICSRLAAPVALGFLLLIPLMTVAGFSQGQAVNAAQARRMKVAETRLAALRQAVASASSNDQLNQQMQRLKGPELGAAELNQPLPQLQAQLRAVLEKADQQIIKEREAFQPILPWKLLPDLLRNAIAALGLAIGFAALAVNPASNESLLQRWQRGWQRLWGGADSNRQPPASLDDVIIELGHEPEDRP